MLRSNCCRFNHLSQHSQYGIVDLLLPASEFPRHGYGSSHVGIVVSVASADIHQENISSATGFLVFDIVENARVFPGGDNGIVGEFAALAYEFMGVLRLDLILFDPWSSLV